MPNARHPSEVRARLAATVVLLDRLLHDLKQPLNFVRMVAQDVRLDAKKNRLDLADIPENMDEIIGAVDRLALSINQLRAFARPDDQVHQAQTIDVAGACRQATHRLRATASDATIDEELSEDLPPVWGDPRDLEQLVWELLDNALQAAGTGGRPRATLQAVARDSNVVVRVFNVGEPIPPQLSSEIFEPFCSTREGAGGIGLALARALASKLGAELNLVASDEKGTIFEILLPTTPHHQGNAED